MLPYCLTRCDADGGGDDAGNDGGAWEDDGIAAGEVRDIMGAVDETFLARMMSVLQDVSTGYLLLEVEVEALEAFLGHCHPQNGKFSPHEKGLLSRNDVESPCRI